MWLYVVAIIAICSWLFYKNCVKPLSIWKDLGIPYSDAWPLIGNFKFILLRNESFMDTIKKLYGEFPTNRYSGMYQMGSPTLMIRDLDLIKRITVRDFDHFTDHRSLPQTDGDPLFTKNLLTLKGDEWRNMRSTLSPTFTSSKMKAMFSLMSKCARQMADYFVQEASGVVLEKDMKDVFSRYANDVIATCAFGVEVDSMRNEENEFYMMGKAVTQVGGKQSAKMILYSIIPMLVKTFNLSIFPKVVTEFFLNTITSNISSREANHIIRPDMLHLLMEARKGRAKHDEDTKEGQDGAGFATVKEVHQVLDDSRRVNKKELTVTDIAAQALLFFFAGFETASTTLCFMSHELAVNPEIQERLQTEIDDALKENDGEINYEMVAKMTYLDMVLCESLRKWPIAPTLDRLCTKDYVIEPVNPDEKPFTVKTNISILIPVVGIHWDENYYPNPGKFDPERFNEDNKHNLQHCYMPFGSGPRNCIGSRFALLEIKILYIHILSKFNFVVTSKTTVPLELSKKTIKMAPDKGFWLGLQKRTNTT